MVPERTRPSVSTTDDSNCQGGWTGYHTHQYADSPYSQPNSSLVADDDIPVWDASYYIHRWTYPLPDTDGDGFTDAAEVYFGTDRLDNCPDNSSDAAWPPDMDNNRRVNILDMLLFKPKLWGSYDRRYDLDVNGTVNILDVLLYKPILGQQCT